MIPQVYLGDDVMAELHAEYTWVNTGLLRCGCMCGVHFTMLPAVADSQTTPTQEFENELKRVLKRLGCKADYL